MRTWLRRIILALAIILIAIQFVPVDRTNPPADPAHSIYAVQPVPANVHAIFDRSCKDCHSNETTWPWYSHVAPVSWMVANDVHEARRKLNLSEWSTYDVKKRDHKLEEICNEILGGDMPDSKYTLIHRQARLTADDHEAVCKWTGSTPADSTPAAK